MKMVQRLAFTLLLASCPSVCHSQTDADFAVSSLALSGSNGFHVAWRGPRGAVYGVEFSTNLQDWTAVDSDLTIGTHSSGMWAAQFSTNDLFGFYRLIQASQDVVRAVTTPTSSTNNAIVWHQAGTNQGIISTTVGLGDMDVDGEYDHLFREDLWDGPSGTVIRLYSLAEQTSTGRYVNSEFTATATSSNWSSWFQSIATDDWGSVTQELTAAFMLECCASNVPYLESLVTTSMYVRFPKSAVTNADDIHFEGSVEIADVDPLIVWHFAEVAESFPLQIESLSGDESRICVTWEDCASRAGVLSVDHYEVAWSKVSWWNYILDQTGGSGLLSTNILSFSAEVTPGWYCVSVTGWGTCSNGVDAMFTGARTKVYVSPKERQGMALIPAGWFQAGDNFDEGYDDEQPVHSVYVTGFYIDKYEVTKAKWDEVCNWAITNGYLFDDTAIGRAATHPVETVSWYDCVKWCNARSEMEGLVPAYYTNSAKTVVYRTGQVTMENDAVDWGASGYRLPTEAEWEKAARGGLVGQRFPWGATINHDYANYCADGVSFSYDTSPYAAYTYHPDYDYGEAPYTSPVAAFGANGYGLHDMTGNVWEWCWDWYDSAYYAASPGTDPRGPVSGSHRVLRGGSWYDYASRVRCARRSRTTPDSCNGLVGFRAVRCPSQ